MARDTWYRLDNVGKFYASQAGRSAQTVFRYAATLADDVDPEALQRALDRTLEIFPSFNVCLRSGAFWHYLEPSGTRPLVQAERLPICHSLHVGARSVLFRVSYHAARLNLEVSHMLSDGRGALSFFKALVHTYICERYGVEGVPAEYGGTDEQKSEDSFDRYFEPGKTGDVRADKVYHLRGRRDETNPSFVELHTSAARVLEVAHGWDVSLTALVAAAVICAVRDGMRTRDRSRTIRIDMPVDLRRHFPSETLKNFFGLAFVTYTPGERDEELRDVARSVAEQLHAGTSPDSLKLRMNRMIALEKNPVLRAMPLPVKDLVLGLADRLGARETTTTVSSLGVIRLDERLAPYVRDINVMTSTAGLNVMLCTFGDDLSISVSSVYAGHEVERRLRATLEGLGMSVRVNASEPDTMDDATEPGADVFPRNVLRRSGGLAHAVLGFVTGTAMLLTWFVGTLTALDAQVSVAIVVALALNYVFVHNVIRHAPDVRRVVARYFLLILAAALAWFAITRQPVVSTFVIPIVCLVALVYDAVLLIVYRGTLVSGYAKYLLLDIAFGLVPLAMSELGLTSWDVLARVSALVSGLLALVLVTFTRRQLVDELHKLFSA